MKKVDLSNWKRKEIYEFYKNLDMPRYQITVEVDVYWFYKFVKYNDLSFYLSFMWLVLSELNQIENFRYRLEGEDVVIYDEVHPSFTDRIDDGETFKIVNTSYLKDLFEFNKNAIEKSKMQKDSFINYDDEKRQDLVYMTSFPWATYTQATNVFSLDPKDAIPRIGWGKYRKEEAKWMMPLTIEVHHAFADGYHVGLLINRIENRLKRY